jgi:hypothetical protein
MEYQGEAARHEKPASLCELGIWSGEQSGLREDDQRKKKKQITIHVESYEVDQGMQQDPHSSQQSQDGQRMTACKRKEMLSILSILINVLFCTMAMSVVGSPFLLQIYRHTGWAFVSVSRTIVRSLLHLLLSLVRATDASPPFKTKGL